MALTADSKNPDAAAFATYLRGPEARTIFETGSDSTVLDQEP